MTPHLPSRAARITAGATCSTAASRLLKGIDLTIETRKINNVVSDHRNGLNGSAKAGPPSQLSGFKFKRKCTAVLNVNQVFCNQWRSGENFRTRCPPFQTAARNSERIEIAILAAEDH